MKRYLPWFIAIGLIIAGATVWYVYGKQTALKTVRTTSTPSVKSDASPA